MSFLQFDFFRLQSALMNHKQGNCEYWNTARTNRIILNVSTISLVFQVCVLSSLLFLTAYSAQSSEPSILKFVFKNSLLPWSYIILHLLFGLSLPDRKPCYPLPRHSYSFLIDLTRNLRVWHARHVEHLGLDGVNNTYARHKNT